MHYFAKFETNFGDIVFELNMEKAPDTVNNFLRYVETEFYNGTVFHHVARDFIIRAGGYDVSLDVLKADEPIQCEADNGLKNKQYTIAMARAASAHSATSQFFINLVDNPELNHTTSTILGWGYTVFGRVIEGTDVVDRIGRVATQKYKEFAHLPAEPVIINKASVIEHKEVPIDDVALAQYPIKKPSRVGGEREDRASNPSGPTMSFHTTQQPQQQPGVR